MGSPAQGSQDANGDHRGQPDAESVRPTTLAA